MGSKRKATMNEKTASIKKMVYAILGILVLFIIAFITVQSFNGIWRKSSGIMPTSVLNSSGIFRQLDYSDGFRTEMSAPQYNTVGQPAPTDRGEAGVERKITQNGSLSIAVRNAEESVRIIQSIAEGMNGFVADSRVYEVSVGVKYGSITIRIPSGRFYDAFDEIKKIAEEVESESVQRQDVTEQYIDIEAHVRNLRVEEAQYTEIMKRAFTVEDTLSVSQRLADVRGRIERLEGQLKYLSRQIDMSSISVSIKADEDVSVFGVRWRPVLAIKQSFRGMVRALVSFADAMIWILFYLPILILWGAVVMGAAFVAWKVFLRVRNTLFVRKIQ